MFRAATPLPLPLPLPAYSSALQFRLMNSPLIKAARRANATRDPNRPRPLASTPFAAFLIGLKAAK